MRIEPELVDAVITGKPVPQEIGDSADLLRQLMSAVFRCGTSDRGSPLHMTYGPDDNGAPTLT
jgi:hypothetical protein